MALRAAAGRDESTVRRQAAHALVDMFDNLYEGAFAVDGDARIVWMNAKFKALLGWNGVEPVEDRPVEDVVPNSRMRRVVETGRGALLDIVEVGDHQVTVSRIPLLDETGARCGALGVILYDRIEALRPLVSKVQRLQSDLDSARRELAESRRAKYGFAHFVGASDVVRDLKRQARRAAESEATVLLLGETGTGKELLAHAIHAASPRGDGPMVRVNVAAIPETLLEAELFGAAPGAYTGADKHGRQGKIQLAQGGTLFLDEVGDMPLALQAKLLRVLQERELEPLGSDRVIPIDVRVIAATARDLAAMVEAGEFRADLYYRLNVLPLRIPALRDRPGDLGLLCDAILEQLADEAGIGERSVAAATLERLARHPWPGNVRELRNVLVQATARSDAEELGPEHVDELLPPSALAVGHAVPAGSPADVRPLKAVVAEAERAAIEEALAATGGVKQEAARRLGISRARFYEKLAALGLTKVRPVAATTCPGIRTNVGLSRIPDTRATVSNSGRLFISLLISVCYG